MNTDNILRGRIKDLANRAYNHNIYTFTNFLSTADMEVFHEMKSDLSFIPYTIFGGREECDRVIIGFGSEEYTGYPMDFPITVIKISPLIEKFSDDLNHRDFLGSLMNLGIEREFLGDIVVKGNKNAKHTTAYVFCVDTMADYIADNLTKIKHTNVKCEICASTDIPELAMEKQDLDFIVASPRIDAVISGLTKLSRSQVVTLFREKKVSLNGRVFENNSYTLKPSDILSVRGYGKFIFTEVGGETRKGKVYVHVQKYV